MIPSELLCQLFTLPPNCDFVVAGIHQVADTQAMLSQAGRKDVKAHSEYWVEGMQWAYDKSRPIVFDARFESKDVWKSTRFLAAREIMRQLKRSP